jgi:5-formyltetrahydrofolate cyclo-ligase
VLKSILRKKILKIRKIKNANNIKIDSRKIIQLFHKEKIFKKNIAGYYPVNYEVDDLDILKKLEKKNFNLSLPVIMNGYDMNFYKWSFNDLLEINKYGIPEPQNKTMVYPDIILVPLVAFDENLNRLGYGGGYYDRLIAKLEKKKNIIKIGLALSCQQINRVPTNKYDKKLDYILTNEFTLK